MRSEPFFIIQLSLRHLWEQWIIIAVELLGQRNIAERGSLQSAPRSCPQFVHSLRVVWNKKYQIDVESWDFCIIFAD